MTHSLCNELDERWWANPPGSTKGHGEDDREWLWLDLWREVAGKDYWHSIAIQTPDGALQGAMIYYVFADSVLEPDRKAVYVDNLASAPWNRPNLTDSPKISGVGSNLILQAIHHSFLLTFGGRVNLATLPGAAGFYESQGFDQTSAIIEGLPVLEISTEQAQRKLLDEGLVSDGENTPGF